MNLRRALQPMAPRWTVLCATCLALFVLVASASSAEAAGPEWKFTVSPNADYAISGSGYAVYRIEAENIGTAPTDNSQPIAITDSPPAGTVPAAVRFFDLELTSSFHGSSEAGDLTEDEVCPTLVECRYPEGPAAASLPPLAPGQRFVMPVAVAVPSSVVGPLEDRASISGGGAPPAEASATNTASPDPPFGLLHFAASISDSSGRPYPKAGGHPYQLKTAFDFASFSTVDPRPNPDFGPSDWTDGSVIPVRDPRAISSDLPPGLLTNPEGVPHCTLADYFSEECASKTAVGDACLVTEARPLASGCQVIEPILNLQPQGETPAELGIVVGSVPFITVTTRVRSGSDYGASAVSVANQADLVRASLVLWGVPADPSHDALRAKQCFFGNTHDFQSIPQREHECETEAGTPPAGGPAEVPPTPYITMPTECSGRQLPIVGRYDTWQVPGEYAERTVDLEPVDGCNALGALFEPSIQGRPTTNLPDAPSGLEFVLHVPQHNEDPQGLVTPALREAVVSLPQGLSVNPSSANGLAACSPQQVGLATPPGQMPAHFTEVPAQCPDASKIGTAKVNTPLLQAPFEGSVYLATPRQNPFSSLLAAYIVLEGEGLIFKLPGQIEADPQTGQLTGKFLENPQLPFEDFHLTFFGGARGDLRTPATCGSYRTTSVMTPYSAPESGPPAEPNASFEITNGGAPCAAGAAAQPNAPVFRAGTESPQAGKFTPLSLRLAREDGSQELAKIETTLPPGLLGRLAGVGECSEAQVALATSREHEGGGAEELASPSCPSSSEVGTVEIASGAGPTPLYVSGHAYLAGPYKGAPLSLAIITPAVAGPFDLGDVVVRAALYVDPFTAQIKAVSDPIPHILQGIPLDVRSITLKMNRPNFTLNPTNCTESHFTGLATSVLGAAAPLTQRFQVGGCRALPFKPKLSLRLKGSPKRSKFPSLTAILTMPPGEANVAAAQVTLPHSSFLAQAHIAKTCGRPELASHTCPAASVYGHAKAVTPLLDHPLEGPVYLATGFGYELPALVADLNGQIEVLLKGKVDSGREDGIRNTFEVVPDAPVSKFTLHMFGGKKSLIENSEYLCGRHAKRKALARFTGQNGKTVELEPTVKNSCKKHGKHKGGKGHRGHHKRQGS